MTSRKKSSITGTIGAGLHQVAEQELLGKLVDDQSGGDEGHGLTIDASHARLSTASSQREAEQRMLLADLPTSWSTRQQRAHFLPVGQGRHDANAGDVRKGLKAAGRRRLRPAHLPEPMQIYA